MGRSASISIRGSLFLCIGLWGALAVWPLEGRESQRAHPRIRFMRLSGGSGVETSVRYWGERTQLLIDGLEPNTVYTLRAGVGVFGNSYVSFCELRSDAQGTVDTALAQPITGTYSKADPDGLFWSMAKVKAGVHYADSEYRFDLEKDGQPIHTALLPFALSKPGVRVVSLEGTGLVGTLHLPALAAGTRPAILTYGGSEGGSLMAEMNAAALANEGFIALSLAYFGAAGLSSGLARIPLEYFEKAIHYLQSRPEVNGAAIGVMGPSRGGELSLLLGATFPEIKAVVAQVPSSVLWAANVPPDRGGRIPPAWTYRGAAAPYLSGSARAPLGGGC